MIQILLSKIIIHFEKIWTITKTATTASTTAAATAAEQQQQRNNRYKNECRIIIAIEQSYIENCTNRPKEPVSPQGPNEHDIHSWVLKNLMCEEKKFFKPTKNIRLNVKVIDICKLEISAGYNRWTKGINWCTSAGWAGHRTDTGFIYVI